jgi:hypothetical protein
MSTSAFLQILAAVEQVLAGAPGLAGVPLYRNRVNPLPRDIDSAVTVRLARSARAVDGPLGAQDWETTVEVECAARGETAQDPAIAVDGLLRAAWAALVDAAPALPGASDVDSDPEIVWEFDSADTPAAVAILRLVVRHRTEVNTLTPWS